MSVTLKPTASAKPVKKATKKYYQKLPYLDPQIVLEPQPYAPSSIAVIHEKSHGDSHTAAAFL